MLKQVPKLVLLVALLVAFGASCSSVFANNKSCQCFNAKCFAAKSCSQGGCHVDTKTLQCINTGCKGSCQFF